jgi:hypothetical protein
MIICIGGCCIPIHLLLAFLVAAAHRHGYLTWFKEEWVTYRFWRNQIRGQYEGLTRRTASAGATEDVGAGATEDVGAGATGSGVSVSDKKTR